MECRPRLNDVFPGWKTDKGIFSALQSFDVPWATDNIASLLDLEYHGNISGDKYISPLISKIASANIITDSERDEIAHIIVAVCGINWNKQYTTMELTYNPIENYSLIEKMVDDRTVNNYGKTTTRTDNLVNDTDNTIHGFNSADGVPTGEQKDTATGTQTYTDGGEDTHTHNYEMSRAGNIGVTTSQQMIQSERDLWKWNFFRDIVFPDIDRILTLQIY